VPDLLAQAAFYYYHRPARLLDGGQQHHSSDVRVHDAAAIPRAPLRPGNGAQRCRSSAGRGQVECGAGSADSADSAGSTGNAGHAVQRTSSFTARESGLLPATLAAPASLHWASAH
jgi:hypothetical protein